MKLTEAQLNSCRALVLNASWQPIETVSWQHAFTKILNGRAKAIDHYDAVVRTPNDELFIPAVILLTEYNGVPPTSRTVYSKRLVLIRDKYTCQYCAAKLVLSTATIDHVVPRSRGGKSNFDNCVASCSNCNKIKGNKGLDQVKMRLIKKPRRPYIHPLYGKVKYIRSEWEPYIDEIFKKQC